MDTQFGRRPGGPAHKPPLSLKKWFFLGGTFLLLILVISFAGKLWEQQNAEEYMVIQAPFSGYLTWHLEQGLKKQIFGMPTHYRISNQDNVFSLPLKHIKFPMHLPHLYILGCQMKHEHEIEQQDDKFLRV